MTVAPSAPPPDGIVTLRELYTLLEKTRAEFILEVQKLQTSMDKKFVDHEAVHIKHETEHDQEHAHQTSLIRWAVTTIISVVGVAIAIYVASKGV